MELQLNTGGALSFNLIGVRGEMMENLSLLALCFSLEKDTRRPRTEKVSMSLEKPRTESCWKVNVFVTGY